MATERWILYGSLVCGRLSAAFLGGLPCASRGVREASGLAAVSVHSPRRDARACRQARRDATQPCRRGGFLAEGAFAFLTGDLAFFEGSDATYSSDRPVQTRSALESASIASGTTTYSRMGRPGIGSKTELP
jgi:hypothetical protein